MFKNVTIQHTGQSDSFPATITTFLLWPVLARWTIL